MSFGSGNQSADPSIYRFLYRDPSGFYLGSNRITREDDVLIPKQEGDAFLRREGFLLDDIGFGYVVIPEMDLAQCAYDRLWKLDNLEDERARAAEADAINVTIALRLGYRVQATTNFPHVTITNDRFASPYSAAAKFQMLPDYLGDLSDALTVASKEWNLNLEQDGESWTASYRHRTTEALFGHKGELVRTVLASALATLIIPG